MGQIHVFGKIVLLASPDIRDPLARAKKGWYQKFTNYGITRWNY
jgi:hypothetical protein